MIVRCNQIGPLTPYQRNIHAYNIREYAAKYEMCLPLIKNICNGDDCRYKNKIGSFTKGFPHNNLGEVNLLEYCKWIEALKTGNNNLFESITLGGTRKFVNPQGAYCYDLIGLNSHKSFIPPAPTFASAETAGEACELYWQALTRDIPFTEYETNTTILQACDDLSRLSTFKGPKENCKVTPKTIFRGNFIGDLTGPYISQFLYKDIPFGSKLVNQMYSSPLSNIDFMTKYDSFLSIQNGEKPTSSIKFSSNYTYIRNGRDLGEYVHRDFSYQAGLNACLILGTLGPECYSKTNPYLLSKTQVGFVTFGDVQFLDFFSKAARVSLEAAWFQKYLVHRRLRPEAYGGCIQNNLYNSTNYPINPEILNSVAINKTFEKFGSYLLPQAYAEGSPLHPSYVSGHAIMLGACVTMLKAFFNEDYIIKNPVMSNSDGSSLIPYTGEALTLGGELNKLASNIAIGRDTAGIHWRSDGKYGLLLGEEISISILKDYKCTYHEKFSGFEFTSFTGKKIVI